MQKFIFAISWTKRNGIVFKKIISLDKKWVLYNNMKTEAYTDFNHFNY